jgi:superoxide dismutase, Fe-Mn family
MEKRKFLKLSSIAGLAAVIRPFAVLEENIDNNQFVSKLQLDLFTVPALGYSFEALEPHIDAMTMEIHHGKHHGAYVSKLNDAVKQSRFETMTIEKIMAEVKEEEKSVRNNGGGHYNHSLFWKVMAPAKDKVPSEKMNQLLIENFGSFEKFKEIFTESAKQIFGSGWAWLSVDANKKLFISTTANQDNPLMVNIVKQNGVPILGIDVWEHAYYLKHQNKRVDYIINFFDIINWNQVLLNFEGA